MVLLSGSVLVPAIMSHTHVVTETKRKFDPAVGDMRPMTAEELIQEKINKSNDLLKESYVATRKTTLRNGVKSRRAGKA